MNKDMFLAKLINMNYDEFFVSSSIDKFWYVKKYMEKEMPEVWEEYCIHIANEIHNIWLTGGEKYTASRRLHAQIDLNNLVTYLSEYQEEWGFKECADWMNEEISPACCNNCEYEKKGLTVHMASYGCFIKHPALVYLEEQCKQIEVKDANS